MSTQKIQIKTKGNTDIINITPQIEEALTNSNIPQGTLHLFIKSTTSALNIIEYESGHLKDLKETFQSLAPENKTYNHNDGNGHSHIRAALQPRSLTIPIQNSELQLGTWQQIVLIDFDNRPRTREIIVQLQGE